MEKINSMKINFFALLPEAYAPFDPIIDAVIKRLNK